MDKIRVLIANDIIKNRGIYRIDLLKEDDIEIIGEIASGEEAIKKTKLLLPDVILLDLNLSSLDGISVTRKITMNNPEIAVIIISPHGSAEHMKKAMLSGARDYLIKPFGQDELSESIRNAYQANKQHFENIESIKSCNKKEHKIPQIVTVFGTKGGVGKTTLSVNLAAQLSKITDKKVVLIDLDLQFGDVAVFLNMLPKRTISELVQEKNSLEIAVVDSYLAHHSSGIEVMPAPMRPEYSELIEADYVMELISVLRQYYDYIIIDTPCYLHDTVLSALDISDQILLTMSMEMPSVKNTKISLDLLETLHHKGKIKLILNRVSDNFGISPCDVETALEFIIANQIPSDGKLVVKSVNRGIPFVLLKPHSKISQCIDSIAKLVISDRGYQKDLEEARQKRSVIKKFLC